MARGRKKLESNLILVEDGLVYIHLQGKNGIGKVAITDIKSYLKYNLDSYVWLGDNKGVPGCDKRQGYAVAYDSKNKREVTMHRLITENTTSLHTDHKNGYTLDNRAENLRICDARENNYNAGLRKDNTTGFKNVHIFKGEYVCNIKIDTVKTYFGSYDKPEMAALAYNIAMGHIAPEFAKLNVIPEGSLTEDEIQIVHDTVNRLMVKKFGKNTEIASVI
jgi:hypothetical protein